MTKFESELLKKLDVLNKNLSSIAESLKGERIDWNKILKPSKQKNWPVEPTPPPPNTQQYPVYEPIPYWLQPGFKMPPITCKSNNGQ